MNQYFAVIEAGGTKFNCAIIDGNRNIIAETRIPTTIPSDTIGASIDFFRGQKAKGFKFDKLGLACFGPLDLKPNSATWGTITSTPKPDWTNTAIARQLESVLDCQVSIDTDVNAAALAEYQWGAARDTSVNVYVTIGTGVGLGIVIDGKPLHGLIHPEGGHMLIGDLKDSAGNVIRGVCPFHGSCIEGLASGTAMNKIWGQPAETLPDDHRAWDVQARVLAAMCHNILLCYSAEKIILGGGVMQKPGLLSNVVDYTEQSLAKYLTLPANIDFSDLICLPGLGDKSGMMGGLALVLGK